LGDDVGCCCWKTENHVTKDDFENRLLRHLTTILESQQSLDQGLTKLIDVSRAHDTEFAKLSRQMDKITEVQIAIRSDLAGLRSDLSSLRAEIRQGSAGIA
jgi:hypothetical protein